MIKTPFERKGIKETTSTLNHYEGQNMNDGKINTVFLICKNLPLVLWLSKVLNLESGVSGESGLGG